MGWRVEESGADYLKDIIARRTVCESGSLLSTVAALRLCAERASSIHLARTGFWRVHTDELVEIPRWLLDIAVHWLLRIIGGQLPRRSGCHTVLARQIVADAKDSARVGRFLLAREEGVPWADAFQAASDSLVGTRWHGSAAAVKKSHERVLKGLKTDRWRYVDSIFVHEVWDQVKAARPQSRKKARGRSNSLRTK